MSTKIIHTLHSAQMDINQFVFPASSSPILLSSCFYSFSFLYNLLGLVYASRPPSLTTSLPISPKFLHPHSTIAVSVSLRSTFNTCLTPSSPPTASPKKMGLPNNTALAPNARPLTTSVPRRTPLSRRRVITREEEEKEKGRERRID